jgi:hypothetical protein
MTVESVKKKMKRKFGTYSDFCRAAKLDRYLFQKDFLTKKKVEREYLLRIARMVERIEPESSKPVFTRGKLKLLKRAVNESGGVIAFCRESGFSQDTVFKVLAYNDTYRTVTPIVKRLLDHFGINP